jgi:hypothetical protein
MVTIRIASAWLFLLGVFELLNAIAALDVPPGTSVTVFGLICLFATPLILIIGSAQLFTGRFIRTAAVAVTVSCAWIIGTFAGIALPPGGVHYDWTFTLIALVLFISGSAVILMWRSLRHLTKR